MNQLKKAVNGKQSTTNYCCGGTIPIGDLSTPEVDNEDKPGSKVTIPPVIIRWDDPVVERVSHRIQFPLFVKETDPGLGHFHINTTTDLDYLINACHSTGLGKLNNSQFSVNFNPYDCGMMDVITQILLPDSIVDRSDDSMEDRILRAELDSVTASHLSIYPPGNINN